MSTLDETNPVLIASLEQLFDSYGPEGVRQTVQQMIDRMTPQDDAVDVELPYDEVMEKIRVEALAEQARPRTLEQDLARVLNRHSVENGTNTPDFILAEYLKRCLQAATFLINRRTHWWGLPDTFEQLVDKPWRRKEPAAE